MIDISNYDRADVLRVLYNNAKVQGMGFLQYEPGDMTYAEAVQYLAARKYFDYLSGRVMKVDLSSDELDPQLYDRDNGDGAAQSAISVLSP